MADALTGTDSSDSPPDDSSSWGSSVASSTGSSSSRFAILGRRRRRFRPGVFSSRLPAESSCSLRIDGGLDSSSSVGANSVRVDSLGPSSGSPSTASVPGATSSSGNSNEASFVFGTSGTSGSGGTAVGCWDSAAGSNMDTESASGGRVLGGSSGRSSPNSSANEDQSLAGRSRFGVVAARRIAAPEGGVFASGPGWPCCCSGSDCCGFSSGGGGSAPKSEARTSQ